MDSATLDRVKNLSPAAQKLLQRKLKERAGPSTPVIPRSALRGRADRFPCSFAQQRLWFLHQVDPEGSSYNSSWPLKVTGELDAVALERALGEVVRRHEVLRTTFEMADEPVQFVAAAVEQRLPVVDLSGLPGEAPPAAAELARLAREHARHRFDLSHEIPLRVSLVVLGKRQHVLLLTLHHIVTDDWSMGVLVREVGAAYAAFSRGLPSPLPDLDLQYADFAHWQRQRLSGEALEEELRYWREQLADLPPPLELPADRPRSSVQTPRGASCSWRFRAALLPALQALGRSQGATLFMTLLSAFQVLLARYSGRDDITVGSPIAGRNQAQLEPLIGCFVNTLALRARLAGDPDFLTALRSFQEVTLGAFAHQDLPFEKLIAELQPERDLARTPIYQVMFSLHNVPAETADMPGVRLERLAFDSPVAKLDLILNVQEVAGGLAAAMEYSRDLFDAATVQRLLTHYEMLLEGIVADPTLPLSALPLLSAAERQALLLEWNDTFEAGVSEACIHQIFAAHAERAPDAPAVICTEDGDRLTYRELAERSSRLACRLRRLGVGPDVRVGLCLDREPALLVGILGILEAGGAYVPLDPGLPQERLAFILEDALGGGQSRLVITREALARRFQESPAVETLLLDVDAEEEGGGAEMPPPSLDGLAYVLYTSGSTGRPKGVAVHHRGLTNYLSWSRWAYRIAEGNGAPVHSSISFDLTVTSLLAPLAAGAPVTLLPESEDAAGSLAQALRGNDGYSLVKLTPAHLRAIGHTLVPEEAEGAARALVVGGEALLAEDLAFWRQHAPATRIINEYGPTETVVGCAVEEVSAETPTSGSVPIGRPIWNSRLYILDRHLRPLPAGVAGEIYIGGRGVARGYLGRPDLTAERFVPSPFAWEAGERLYRTGDLARALSDGRLDYLGRADDQVKIRGYRIEPGEIEAQLAAHPGLSAAAVVVGRGAAGSPRLVAYVVPAPGQAPGAPEEAGLRRFLAERLPEYMVPAAFVSLEALPLTSNGKVDRRALSRLEPSVERAKPVEEADAAPLNPVEELLIGIWKQVLGRDEVGRHDNFFELGGDSILSLQITSRARQAGVRLTSRQLFANPTVAGLASVAKTISVTRSEEKPTAAEVPLTPIQRWFFEQGLSHPEHANLSVLLEVTALTEGNRLPASFLRRAVELLLAHHDALRFRFEPPAADRPSWRQVSSGPSAHPASFVHVDLSQLPHEKKRPALEEAVAEIQATFCLTSGPLLRAALYTLGAAEPDRLLLVAHHLIVDGVSWRVLLEDLEMVCRQLDRGEPAVLPPATTSFQSWARRLVDHARSGVLDTEAEEWLRRIQEVPPPLPRDRDAGPNSAGSARSVVVALDAAETRALLQEVPRAYRTQINDVLLAALAQAFERWTGNRRLLLELEGHGREDLFEDVDLSRTVGWFTSHFPVLLDLEGASTPGEALKAAKEQLRAVPGRGIGWGLLRYLREGDFGGSLRRLPHPEVVFNFLGQLDQAVSGDRLFRPARESAGAERHRSHARPALFEVAGAVGGDQLHVRFVYSENRHLRSTVERLAQDFVSALRTLISHCLTPGVAGCTPSDFPLAHLEQPVLDRLVASTAGRIEDLYPASPMQQGMLFHALQAPASGVYVVQIGISLNVGLDVPAFERAWEKLIERHPVMRTAFAWDGLAVPLQVVSFRVQPAWLHLDWRALSATEQASRLAAYLKEDRRRGFELARPPLLRFCLIRTGEQSYRFLWSLHHLITDGWSSPIVLRELFALYKALATGEEPRLGEPRPYRDYIAWLTQQDPGAAEELWRRNLAGFSAPTSLGVDRGATAQETPAGAYGSCEAVLSAAATEGLRALARRHQLTLNTLLQGAWALLLGRYSGDEDVLFGAVTAGRSAPVEGIEQMVGLFINTLPMRAKLAPEAELLGWLQDLQERQAEVRQYEHTPLSQVRAWSEMGPGASLFESILIFENYPVDDSVRREVGEALQIGEVRVREQTNYPVTVVVGPARRLTLEIAYDGGRIDAQAAARMLRHLRTGLEGMLDGLHLPLVAVPLLTPGEQHQVLHEWNDDRAGIPENLPENLLGLHELFEIQAARLPDAPAVVFDGRTLTYRELGRWADRLATWLQGLGLRPGARVGLCLQRSPAALSAMLGVLKAGAAYVPLDPESPPERLAAIVADSGMELLLTSEHLAPALATVPARVLTLASEAAGEGTPSSRESVRRAWRDECAYVIYTSGSTGVSKGVEVTHRGVVNYVRGMLERVPLGSGDRILLFAPLSFDASVVQIFPALASGACVVVHPNPRELTGADILTLCEREQLTVLDLPAVVWRQWVQDVAALRRPLPARLRTFLTGGESVPAAMFRAWAGLTERRVTFLSSYGPTEATVAASVFLAENSTEPAWAQVPIGRPLPNVRVHVLDRWLRPTPVGVPGQLFLGGPGLARGYLGRPDLTAEVFLPDPLPPEQGGEPGGRLYRTADLARYLPDGNLEFLGRADHQVKVRGFRIELAEIETVLSRHPSLREAVVLLREDRPGDKRLVAYIVLQAAAPTVSDLRAFLAAALPPYMLPSAFLTLDSIPVLASGKVDRAALPAPDADRPDLGGEYTAPRTAEEELLARIWAQVLRVEKVGVFDNFFELGGDSILSIQIIARASQAGLRLTPKQLFDHQTVAELARAAQSAPGVHAEQGPVGGPVPLLPIQHWFFEQGFRRPHHFNNAFLLAVREPTAPIAPAVLARLAERMVEHHDALRLRFTRTAESWEQTGVTMEESESPSPWGSIDLRSLPAPLRPGALLAAEVELQSEGIDLARGPLTRLVLFDLGEGESRLLWMIHHLAVDGVSWRILLEDLETAYRQIAAGGEPVLPPKTTSFKQWAERLVDLAGSGALRAERDHWLSLAAAPCPPLPLDFVGGREAANTLASMRSVTVSLSPEETQSLLQEVPATYHTQIDEVLLTALARGFSAWTGSTALRVNREGHGREPLFDDVDLSRTVGWFTTQYPVVVDPGATEDWGEALMMVKEQLRRIPGRGIGYGLLRYLGGDAELERSLGQAPEAEVSFNYLGQFETGGSASDTGAASMFSVTNEPTGPDMDLRDRRPHLLEISGVVSGGRLHLRFNYSSGAHQRATIERLAEAMAEGLLHLIERSRLAGASVYSASDFPLAALDNDSFRELSALLDDDFE